MPSKKDPPVRSVVNKSGQALLWPLCVCVCFVGIEGLHSSRTILYLTPRHNTTRPSELNSKANFSLNPIHNDQHNIHNFPTHNFCCCTTIQIHFEHCSVKSCPSLYLFSIQFNYYLLQPEKENCQPSAHHSMPSYLPKHKTGPLILNEWQSCHSLWNQTMNMDIHLRWSIPSFLRKCLIFTLLVFNFLLEKSLFQESCMTPYEFVFLLHPPKYINTTTLSRKKSI